MHMVVRDLKPPGVLAEQARFADVADLAILDPAGDFAQNDAIPGAADEAAIGDVEMLDPGCGEQRAVVRKRLRAAVEHEPGEANILRLRHAQNRVAVAIAEDREAGHAFNLRSGFEGEAAGRIDAGWEEERRSGLGRLVGGKL